MHNIANKSRSARLRFCAAMAVFLVGAGAFLCSATATAENFRQLAAMSPEGANAIVLMNVEKLLSSPYGQSAGWQENLEEAFRSGLARVPPEAKQVVLTAQLDFEFMEPVWEAMLITSQSPIDLTSIAKGRGGSFDKVEQYTAVRFPTDAYAVRIKPTVIAAMSPANRQWVVRWVRRIQSAQGGLSPYLAQAAGYSDDAGSEIIMAVDLDGVMAPSQVERFLKESGILEGTNLNGPQVAARLASIKGVRLGIRVGEKPSGMVVVDFADDVSILAPVAKKLVAQWIDLAGLHFDDFDQWKAKANDSEISLSGYFSEGGLRRVLSVIQSPEAGISSGRPSSPGDEAAAKAQNTLKYYREVTSMFDDLKKDWRDLKTLASASAYFDKYAKRIDKLPILNVDKEMVAYGHFVAQSMRQAASAVRTMGIRGGVRTRQVTSSATSPYAYGNYRYGRYGYYGGYGAAGDWAVYDPRMEARAVMSERRAIKAQERGAMATSVWQIRDKVAEETQRIRQVMTERYQVEF